MEWDLDPSEAQQLRDEAKKSVRVRIDASSQNNNNKNSSSAFKPTTTARPISGEYFVVELQGELLYPEEVNTKSKNGGKDDDVDAGAEEGDSNQRFTVGTISEDEPAAAKSKALLKMGTLLVEGDRSKIPGATLVLIDKKLQRNNSSSTQQQQQKVGNENLFGTEHAQMVTTRRGRSNAANNNNNDDDDDEYLDPDEEAQREIEFENRQQSRPVAPNVARWHLLHETSQEADLLKCLDERDVRNKDSVVAYEVKGVLAQKYLFKSKPSRQTKIS